MSLKDVKVEAIKMCQGCKENIPFKLLQDHLVHIDLFGKYDFGSIGLCAAQDILKPFLIGSDDNENPIWKQPNP